MTYAILKSRNNGATIILETLGYSSLPAANRKCENLNQKDDGWKYYAEKIEKVAQNDHIDGSEKAAKVAVF